MEGWKTATLGEACQFINGLWKGEDPPFVNVGVIRNTNFTKDGTLDDTDIAYLDVEAKKFAKRRLQFGDLILEKSGGGPKQPVGRVVLFDKTHGDFSFSNFTAAIRVNELARLDPRYLHRYLHWFYLSGRTEAMQSHSTGIRNLNGGAYKAISINYPPITEQRRIVAILDEAFDAITTAKANAEKNLQNAREVFDSHLQSVVSVIDDGWTARTLNDVCEKITDGKHGDCADEPGSGYFFLSAKDVRDGTLQYEKARQITKSDFLETHRRTNLEPGDILITNAGTIGRMAVAPTDDRTCRTTFQKSVAVLKLKRECIDARFAYYGLTAGLRHFVNLSAGAAQKNLLLRDLRSYSFQVPVTLAAQRLIASQCDELAKLTRQLGEMYERKLAALDELKKSLLHQAFTGALTAKDTDKQLEAVA